MANRAIHTLYLWINSLSEFRAMKKSRILQGDCLEVLKGLPANSVDSICTDPPYGLSKEPDIAEVMQHWIAGDHYKHGSAGFMGKTWDSFVPGPEYWRECLRVLKPGGHMLVFAGTRTWDLMSVAIRFAGGELRDTVQWVYGSGFPKSHCVSKAIDRAAGIERKLVPRVEVGGSVRSGDCAKGWKNSSNNGLTSDKNALTPAAKKWSGFGTALKPAWEPILVFRKPLEKGLSIAENVLKYGTGGLNIDASRIEAADQTKLAKNWNREMLTDIRGGKYNAGKPSGVKNTTTAPTGRFPANLLLSHTLFCVQKGVKRVKGTGPSVRKNGAGFNPRGTGNYGTSSGVKECVGYGTETVEAWECDESCPVLELDRQSGTRKSPSKPVTQGSRRLGWDRPCNEANEGKGIGFGDSGGASRFFYVCKPSRRERNAGCEGLEKRKVTSDDKWAANDRRSGTARQPTEWKQDPQGNGHPTVKPLKLMRYLITMVTPPGGCVLDPFAGSGTTLAAAKSLGFRFIGIEMDRSYIKIARARVKAA